MDTTSNTNTNNIDPALATDGNAKDDLSQGLQMYVTWKDLLKSKRTCEDAEKDMWRLKSEHEIALEQFIRGFDAEVARIDKAKLIEKLQDVNMTYLSLRVDYPDLAKLVEGMDFLQLAENVESSMMYDAGVWKDSSILQRGRGY